MWNFDTPTKGCMKAFDRVLAWLSRTDSLDGPTVDLLSHCFSMYLINCCVSDLADDWSSNIDLTSSNPGLTSSTGRSGSDRRHLNKVCRRESSLSIGSTSPICAYASPVLAQSETNNLKRSGCNRRQHEQLSQGLPRNQRWFWISANLVRELHNCSNRESVHCLCTPGAVHERRSQTDWDRFVLAYTIGILEFSLLSAFHTLSLLHFPLPHFQRPLTDD